MARHNNPWATMLMVGVTLLTTGLIPVYPLLAQDDLEQLHRWQDTRGNSVEAKFVSYEKQNLTLERADGSTIQISYRQLDRRSKALAKRLRKMAQKSSESETNASESTGENDPRGNADKEMDGDPVPPVTKDKHDPKQKRTGKLTINILDAEGSPNPDCPRCLGHGLVGTKSFKPLIFFDGKKGSIEEHAVGDSCPICQKGRDPMENMLPFAATPDIILQHHEQWNDELGRKSQLVQLRFLVLHSQLPDKETQAVAEALERFEFILQKTFGNFAFTNRRRKVDEMFVLADQKRLARFIDVLATKYPGNQVDWETMKRLTFSSYGQTSFVVRRPQLIETLSSAVYGTAVHQMSIATNTWSRSSWLRVGFAAHFEQLVTRKNLCYMSPPNRRYDYPKEYGEYDGTTPGKNAPGGRQPKIRRFDFNGDWDVGIRKLAKENRIVPWSTMLYVNLRNFEIVHDLQSKSMVGFLTREPENFIEMVEQIKNGVDAMEAMQKAYGRDVLELERDWIKSVR